MSSIGTQVGTHARATLDAWRERGADRLDPVRFHFIEALERRAAGYSGDARRILDDKLSKLMDVYADDVARAASTASNQGNTALLCEPTRGPLGGLLDHLASHAPAPRPSTWPELEMLDYFRKTWSRFSTEKQLRKSLEQVPGNAGPLNSSSLVHRSLSMMRELSPGYLEQFLSYVDALSWMEQMTGGDASADKDAPRGGKARKSTRGKAR